MNSPTANVNRRVFRRPMEAFAEHLAEQFEMCAESALAHVNRELAAHPLTRDIQLQLQPADLPPEQK